MTGRMWRMHVVRGGLTISHNNLTMADVKRLLSDHVASRVEVCQIIAQARQLADGGSVSRTTAVGEVSVSLMPMVNEWEVG